MSKRVEVTATCPNCGKQYQGNLFRTVWGEHDSLRSAVMNNNINILECPHCGHKFHAPLAMLYVDVVKQFAVWWEPVYDPQIDEMTAGFSKMLGHGNYYETAPRISDWEEFKETINRYYSGELKGQSEEVTRRQKKAFSNMSAEISKKSNRSGCLSMTFLTVTATALIYTIFL